MSRIRANTIVNGAGTGAPNFPRGAIISGISTITADINIGTGASISSPATNALAFGTNSSERIRIDAQGAIIGSGLQTNNDGRNLKGLNVKSPAGVSFQNFGGNGSRNWRLRPDDLTAWGSLEFSVSPTDNDDTDWPDSSTDVVLELKKDKNVVVKNGNLVIGTSGKGIDFSATSDGSGTMTSELLDDYEEGTFTPILSFGGGTTGITYTQQSGTYTKVGRLVTCIISIVLTSKGTSTGGMSITGLPYAVADNIPSTSLEGGGQFNYQANVSGTTYGQFQILTQQSTSGTVVYRATNTSGTMNGVSEAQINNSFDSRAIFYYYTT
jgi:hypothetical protein